jgi:hypothetical protein
MATITQARATAALQNTQKILDKLEITKSWLQESTGFLHVRGVGARIGVQPYPNHPVFGDVAMFRDEVFLQQMAEGLKNKPLVRGHFDVTPTQNNEAIVGWIAEALYQNGLVIVEVVIHDAPLIQQIYVNKEDTPLSVGYEADLKVSEGVWDDAQGLAGIPNTKYKYGVQQLNPVINHLAVVETARAGPIARLIADGLIVPSFNLLDSLESDSTADNGMGDSLYPYQYPHTNSKRTRKIMDEQFKKELKDTLADMITPYMDAMSKYCDAINKSHDSLTDGVKRMQDDLKATLDMVGAIREAHNTQEFKAAQVEPEQTRVKTERSYTRDSLEAPVCEKSSEAPTELPKAIEVWVRHGAVLKDELDFDASVTDCQRTVLIKNGYKVTDSMSGEVVQALYDMFVTTEEKLEKEAPKESPTRAKQLFDSLNLFKDKATDVSSKTESFFDDLAVETDAIGNVRYL